MGMSSRTLQKTPAILGCIVTEIWPRQNTNSKSVFFWPKLPKCLAKLNFDFLLHNFSRYVIFGIFCKFFARKVLGDLARTRKRYRQTDGRTHIHGGKNNICLPQGETYNNNNKSRCKEMERSMITRTSFWNKK